MRGLSLGLGMNAPVSGSGGVSAPIPANYDFIVFGDSRFENGFNILNNASGLAQSTSTIGMQAWLEIDSGYKLRLAQSPNFSISASNTYQGSAMPRQNAVGAVTTGDYWRSLASGATSDNKGAEFFETHPAGIGVLLYGTNDQAVSDPGYNTTSRTNITTILDRAPSKVWVVCSELPKGIKDDGTSGGQTVTANFKAFSDWLKTLSFDSGHANARANVIVADTFAALVDPATGTNYNNLRGILWDGLHWSPGGARAGAAAILSKLQSVWNWAGISPRITLPTTADNGLAAIANAQPFITSNADMVPGTNGGVAGTWTTPPSAANIPQGWTITTAQATTLTCVADKTEVDDEGYPVLKLTIGGTLAAGPVTNTIWVYQTAPIASLFSGSLMTISDKLRAVGKCKVSPGAQYLQGVSLACFLQTTTVAKYQTNKTATGPTVINATSPAFIDAFANDAWMRYQTQLMDLQDPGKVALSETIASSAEISNLWLRWEIDFRNLTASGQTVSAVVRISRSGIQRV